jgi:hypothetical protein
MVSNGLLIGIVGILDCNLPIYIGSCIFLIIGSLPFYTGPSALKG